MSEATQHCCENNCHNIPFYDEKTERGPRKGDTSSWPTVKQEEANCHKAMDKTPLTSCILFKQRASYCCACRPHHWGHRGTSTSVPSVSKTPVHHRRSTPTIAIDAIDAIDATKPPTALSTPSKPSTRPLDSTQAIVAPTTPAFFIVYLIFDLIERTAPGLFASYTVQRARGFDFPLCSSET